MYSIKTITPMESPRKPKNKHVCVCVCVCECVRVFVTNQDIDLYNDTGMTQVLQGEGDFSGH